MKGKNMLILDDKDEKAVQLFSDLGMPKNLAKTLMYIYQVDECRAAEVEQGADLRQPEVSIAMQELRNKGWIKKRDLKKSGKGRPVHIYSTSSDLGKILKDFEQEKMKEADNIKSNISELKTIINSR